MAITLSRPADTSPEPKRFRTWLRKILTGGQIIETCPAWCTDSHANGHTDTSIDDLQHGASLPGVELDIFDWQGGTVPVPVLSPRIAVEPYSSDPARQTPHILLEVAEDTWTAPLDAVEFAEVIRKVRGHLDALESQVLPQLLAAVVENGATR